MFHSHSNIHKLNKSVVHCHIKCKIIAFISLHLDSAISLKFTDWYVLTLFLCIIVYVGCWTTMARILKQMVASSFIRTICVGFDLILLIFKSSMKIINHAFPTGASLSFHFSNIIILASECRGLCLWQYPNQKHCIEYFFRFYCCWNLIFSLQIVTVNIHRYFFFFHLPLFEKNSPLVWLSSLHDDYKVENHSNVSNILLCLLVLSLPIQRSNLLNFILFFFFYSFQK